MTPTDVTEAAKPSFLERLKDMFSIGWVVVLAIGGVIGWCSHQMIQQAILTEQVSEIKIQVDRQDAKSERMSDDISAIKGDIKMILGLMQQGKGSTWTR